MVKLTSGSTGAPRGIATSAEALLADDAALTAHDGLSGRPTACSTTIPLSHSYGLASLALPALARGTLLVMPEAAGVYDPFVTAARLGATFFPTVPAYLDALARMGEPPPRPASLRLVITAGAPLAAATAAPLPRDVRPAGPRLLRLQRVRRHLLRPRGGRRRAGHRRARRSRGCASS